MKKQIVLLRDRDSEVREAKRIAFESRFRWRHIGTFAIGKWDVLLFEYSNPVLDAFFAQHEESNHAAQPTT